MSNCGSFEARPYTQASLFTLESLGQPVTLSLVHLLRDLLQFPLLHLKFSGVPFPPSSLGVCSESETVQK